MQQQKNKILSSKICDYIQAKASLIEECLDGLIVEQPTPYKRLLQAARYALLGAGKKLRPILTIATTEIFLKDSQPAVIPACTIEMIHAYSLIHDDLPCMDDDDYRRGKPSVHKAFGEATAVLTGDYLLTFAFEALAETSSLTSDQKINLIALLAKRAGSNGMVMGQFMDIEAEDSQPTLDHLSLIHEYKTGAMIQVAIEFGGIIGHANEQQMEALRLFGKDLGLAFQIIDDVIDVVSSTQKHGKSIASDESNCKTTYASLLGVDQARQKASDLLESANSHLARLGHDATLLQNLANCLVHRDI